MRSDTVSIATEARGATAAPGTMAGAKPIDAEVTASILASEKSLSADTGTGRHSVVRGCGGASMKGLCKIQSTPLSAATAALQVTRLGHCSHGKRPIRGMPPSAAARSLPAAFLLAGHPARVPQQMPDASRLPLAATDPQSCVPPARRQRLPGPFRAARASRTSSHSKSLRHAARHEQGWRCFDAMASAYNLLLAAKARSQIKVKKYKSKKDLKIKTVD